MPMTKLAQRIMTAWTELNAAEDALSDAVLQSLGVEPDDLNAWPYQDLSWDWHDMSIELYGVMPGWRMTLDQFQQIREVTGFDMVFVNYRGGTERQYYAREGALIEGEARP